MEKEFGQEEGRRKVVVTVRKVVVTVEGLRLSGRAEGEAA